VVDAKDKNRWDYITLEKEWNDLLDVVVSVVVVVALVDLVTSVFNKTIGSSTANITSKPKATTNANVRGHVEHPKHPLIASLLFIREESVVLGSCTDWDGESICAVDDLHNSDGCNSNDGDN
jgi:hypothetical protein